jgi:hypothetical protein
MSGSVEMLNYFKQQGFVLPAGYMRDVYERDDLEACACLHEAGCEEDEAPFVGWRKSKMLALLRDE